jgi:hypothetical protein
MSRFISKVDAKRRSKQRQAEIAARAQSGVRGSLTRTPGYRILESVRDVPTCFHDYIPKGEAA